jgi:hypothetical protein
VFLTSTGCFSDNAPGRGKTIIIVIWRVLIGTRGHDMRIGPVPHPRVVRQSAEIGLSKSATIEHVLPRPEYNQKKFWGQGRRRAAWPVSAYAQKFGARLLVKGWTGFQKVVRPDMLASGLEIIGFAGPSVSSFDTPSTSS